MTLLASCSSGSQNVTTKTRESTRSSDPLEGLPEGAYGTLVVGKTTYWVGSAVVQYDPEDNSDYPSRPLDAVRRFNDADRTWSDLPALPGKPASLFVQGVVVGDTLAVLYKDCEGGTIDPDDAERNCTGADLATLPLGASEWNTTPVDDVIDGAEPIPDDVTLKAFADRLLVEAPAADGGRSLWSLDPVRLGSPTKIDNIPAELGARPGVSEACPTPDGLVAWAPVYASADGRILSSTEAGIGGLGNQDAPETRPAGTAVAVLSRDGRWSDPVVEPGYAPFTPPLGCTADGIALRARDIRSQAGGESSQRYVAIAIGSTGAATELPIDVGSGPSGTPGVDLRFTAQGPTVASAEKVTRFDDDGMPTCSVSMTSSHAASIYELPSGAVFREVVPGSGTYESYEYLECR
jgi:hypothetical protein